MNNEHSSRLAPPPAEHVLEAAAPPPAAAPDAGGTTLRGLLTVMRRNRGMLVLWVLAAFGAAAAGILQLTPRFRASALVMVDMRELNLGDVRGPLTGPVASLDTTIVRSQVEVLASEEMARRVVADLGLEGHPDFSPRASRRERVVAYATGVLQRVEAALVLPPEWRLVGEVPTAAPPPNEADRSAHAIEAYRRALSISNDGRSFAISVSFQSTDPRLAARVANRHAMTYVDEQRRAKRDALRVAGAWLADEVEDQAGRLRVAEQALQDYRERNRLFAPRGISVVAQQLSEVNGQLASARADLAEKDARLRSAQQAARQTGRGDAEARVMASETISRLRDQEATARRRAVETSTQRGERHPDVLSARAEVREIQTKIAEEVQSILRGQDSEAAIARVRVQELQLSVTELERRLAETERAEAGARDLERVAVATRTLYENLLVRHKQFAAQEGIQQADARVVSPAGTPARPTFPNLPLFLTVAFLGSCGSGVGLVLLRERLRSRITSIEEAAALAGLPGLGVLPRASVRSPMHRRVVERPKSAAAEAMRTLRSALVLSQRTPEGRARGPRTLAITSSLPGEGKTTTAVAMARSMAASGLSVLLIDADLRKPKVARLVWGRPPATPGLATAIEEELPLASVLVTDHATPLRILHASDRAPNSPPQDLLASMVMRRLIVEAAQTFDCVVVDTPPAGVVTDAAIVGRQVDSTLLVARWNHTPAAALRATAKSLATARVPMVGLVLNDADPARLPEYSVGATYAIGSRKRYFEA